jgi:hypothetical protein
VLVRLVLWSVVIVCAAGLLTGCRSTGRPVPASTAATRAPTGSGAHSIPASLAVCRYLTASDARRQIGDVQAALTEATGTGCFYNTAHGRRTIDLTYADSDAQWASMLELRQSQAADPSTAHLSALKVQRLTGLGARAFTVEGQSPTGRFADVVWQHANAIFILDEAQPMATMATEIALAHQLDRDLDGPIYR